MTFRFLERIALTLALSLALICQPLQATTTSTFSLDSTAYVAVTATTVCHYITVYEAAQAGTTQIYLKAPGSNSTPVTRPAGQRITLTGSFQPGVIAGYVKAVSVVTITMDQEED